MAYCAYDNYIAMGGVMDEARFAVWAERASRLIDRLTYGRAEELRDKVAPELADACGQLVDLLQRQNLAQKRLAFGAVASASNDGYSETAADPSSAAGSAEACAYTILRNALGADRYGLLYRGVYPC